MGMSPARSILIDNEYNTCVSKPSDLIAYLFDGQPHLLSASLLLWMEASLRFTRFVEIYRDKIRKKIRTAVDPGSALDLQGELLVAACLLTDRRLEVAYEPYASARHRGPDFAVTYRANTVFNVEVARMRVEAEGTDLLNLPHWEDRLLRILLDKLGQMQAGMPNLLAVHTASELALSLDLPRLMHSVKTRAEARDPSLYAHSRYTGPTYFYRDFLHLNGILLWASTPQLWVNKPARPTLDEKVLRLVASLAERDPGQIG